MAKNKSSRGKRDHNSITNVPLLVPHVQPLPVYQSPLVNIEDNRSWHPEGRQRAARTTSGHPVNVNKLRDQKRFPFRNQTKALLSFPPNVVTCVRRKQRREVLHALYGRQIKRFGKSGGRNKTWRSKIKC